MHSNLDPTKDDMSVKPLFTHPLLQSDRETWEELVKQHGCIFDSLSWSEIFPQPLNRIGIYDAGNNLRGGFCVYEQHMFRLRILRNPPFTSQIGPFFEFRASNPSARTDEQRSVAEAMAEYLSASNAAVKSLSLSSQITDCLPFFWRGWKVIPHYTYRIDLTQSQDAILNAMSSERRKNLRKSVNDGVYVSESFDFKVIRDLVLQSFSRQKKHIPLTSLEKILFYFSKSMNSYCMIAQIGGRPIAGVYIVHDHNTAYYLLGGYTDGAHHGAGALAMWSAIEKAKKIGLQVFDFEGSSIQPVERYFRGFGGQLTQMLSIHRAWLPIEMALKTIPRFRNRF